MDDLKSVFQRGPLDMIEDGPGKLLPYANLVASTRRAVPGALRLHNCTDGQDSCPAYDAFDHREA
ncbi:hypothetical protein ACFXKF_32800 [Streptomyces scopuliridis]|uniref:hypothetical protein n=1 Tax=Streptomyces scopuliridis TaxID=452529 RepID=UPI00369EDBAB